MAYKAGQIYMLNKLMFNTDIRNEEFKKSLLVGKPGVFGSVRSKRPFSIIDISEQRKICKDIEKNKELDLIKFASEVKLSKRKSLNKRTVKPSNNILSLLNLKLGKNTISFTCTSRLYGTTILNSEIYLWDYNDKIIISDVDGTITKSDVLGHVLPMFGKDWTHSGVCSLFNSIDKNNYKILYLTARPLCQSEKTKNYLRSIKQDELILPNGPLLLNPDGLISAFKREVIDRTPQKFKIACLLEIGQLFPINPFFAGFGNRKTDAVSYRSVGIELTNIFIINEKGEVIQLNNSMLKTYSLLSEIADEVFPKLK